MRRDGRGTRPYGKLDSGTLALLNRLVYSSDRNNKSSHEDGRDGPWMHVVGMELKNRKQPQRPSSAMSKLRSHEPPKLKRPASASRQFPARHLPPRQPPPREVVKREEIPVKKEHELHPERLNLDRKNLKIIPLQMEENRIKLLNLQNNLIERISNLNSLQSLIFLDLYSNEVKEISGLEGVPTLRVLMLGKNNISRIEGLENLHQLDVLDLHSNMIEVMENISHLKQLRVLNLAGNRIRVVENVSGLDSLTELNLRRNEVEIVTEVDTLQSLQRLFLSANKLESNETIKSVLSSKKLLELSLDGNPLCSDLIYRQYILDQISSLRYLDNKRITEEERRISKLLAKKRAEKKMKERELRLKEEKEKAIQKIQKWWESECQGEEGMEADVSVVNQEEMYDVSDHSPTKGYTEVMGNIVSVVGENAEFTVEKSVQMKANVVVLRFMKLERILDTFFPLAHEFPLLKEVQLLDNSISSLRSLLELNDLPSSVNALRISGGNPASLHRHFREFVAQFLPKIKVLNGETVSKAERMKSVDIFSNVGQLIERGPVLDRDAELAQSTAPVADRFVNAVFVHGRTIDMKIHWLNENWPGIVREVVLDCITEWEKLEI